MLKKTIFIPIEIKTRDYFPRLLIASELLNKNFDIIFGRKRELEKIASYSSNAIYLGLQSTRSYVDFYKKLKKKKFKIVIIDEEGLSTLNKKFYLSVRASNDLFKSIDKFLCWGNYQYKQIKNFIKKDYRNKLECTGNTRIDVLKKKFEILFNLNNADFPYKNFILINLAFGQINHFQHHKSYLQHSIKNNLIQSKFEIANYKKFLRFKFKRFQLYKTLILKLAETFPNQIFIIRPHPSENVKTYKFLSKFENIVIDKKINHISLIKRSRFVITDFCTTAIESILLNTNTYVYKRPKKNYFLDETYYRLPKNIHSFGELCKIIKQNKRFKNKKNYSFRIKNLKKFSYQEISYSINKFKFTEKKNYFQNLNDLKFVIIKIYLSLFFKFKKNLYTLEKCEDLDVQKIKIDLNKVNKLLKNKKKYKISNICNSVFKFTASRKYFE